MNKKVNMRRSLVFAGALLLAAGTAVAGDDDYGRIEFAPAFAYVHNGPILGGQQSFNCAGGGGTITYNLNSVFGLAADLTGCKAFGLDNTFGIGSKINGDEFTYVFGPRVTFRLGRFQPFLNLNVGGEFVSVGCNTGNRGNACGTLAVPSTPTTPGQLPVLPVVTPHAAVIVPISNPFATSVGDNTFAMTVGGGIDIRLNKRFAIRLVQAEYLYTRFENSCAFAICSENNNQNSFRLQSGVVIGWGGPK
jgi:opacity protein-like surface antigen